MNELGETSQASHRFVARLCDPKKLDLVVTLGVEANEYIAPLAKKLGCRVVQTKNPYDAARLITENLKKDALILCKGSQNGVFAEETVKLLLKNPADSKKLVRQSEFWLNKKQQQFEQ
jgi:UDP-N-acetylmuramyl pentapeptide synthase